MFISQQRPGLYTVSDKQVFPWKPVIRDKLSKCKYIHSAATPYIEDFDAPSRTIAPKCNNDPSQMLSARQGLGWTSHKTEL